MHFTLSLALAMAMLPLLHAYPTHTHTLPQPSQPFPTSNLYSSLVSSKVSTIASSFAGTYPQYTTRDTGKWLLFSPNTWTSGFFPATLYALNSRANGICTQTSDPNKTKWLGWGRQETGPISAIADVNTVEHDVGFISFPFQEELKVNPSNQTAQTIVKKLAATLAGRYNAKVGCTRSWDTADPTDFKVIIDNMINLQLLFASNALSKNQTLIDIAISHADKTMANHLRADGSSYHVVEYNSTTGTVFHRGTAQGYSDSSTWSRGQSWGIFGFAMMYSNTGLDRYLTTARRMAAYFLSHTPSNGVVPWDFNAPGPLMADTSAMMIATNAYLLLAQIEQSHGNSTGSKLYMDAASKLLNGAVTLAWKPSWQSILSNGTVNNPAANNDTGTVYGDYYFVQAGNTLANLGLTSC